MEMTPNGEGECFEIAGMAIVAKMDPDAFLVHAEVEGQGPVAGRRFPHAWIEIGDNVYDYSGNRHVGPKEPYYALGKPTEIRRYTRIEAMVHIVETEHWGPWEDKEDENGC